MKVGCPNESCYETVQCGLMDEHLSLLCNFTEVPCKYASIACDLWLICKEIEEHQQDIEYHFPIAANTITEFANSIRELTRRMAKTEGLPIMIKEEPQVTVIISKYGYKKRTY